MTEKMIGNILLRTGDGIGEREYGRMLELELADRGIRVNEKGAEPFALLLVYGAFDTARAEKDAAGAEGIPVFCCAPECEGSAPAGMLLIDRPAEVDRLCDLLLSFRPGEKAFPAGNTAGGGLVLDRGTRTVYCAGEAVSLSAREFRLFSYLYDNRGREISGEELLSAVWDDTSGYDTNVVKVYIRYLRKKLDERFELRLIRTVRGKGYLLKE